MPKGFLLVLMQPPITFEEEFNAWYDLEHVPERLAVPGVETAYRYVSVAGNPRYMAMYDLSSKDVLETEAYLAVAGDRSSPWTKRVTGRVRVYRSVGDQVYPGNKSTPLCGRVQLVRIRGLGADAQGSVVTAMKGAFEKQPETLDVRVFAYEVDGKVDYLGFVAASAPFGTAPDMRDFGPLAASIDIFNSYTPY